LLFEIKEYLYSCHFNQPFGRETYFIIKEMLTSQIRVKVFFDLNGS
jgi:hypothetical protein